MRKTTELSECTRCHKIMIDEEHIDHECIPKIKSHRIIKYTHYHLIREKDGKTTINITTKNGTWLECVEIPEDKEHTKIPYQPRGNTHNNQPDSSQNHFFKNYVQIS
ncbi:MAG: hypothetical protein ACE5DL_05910 [Nitrosopumilaceae archaeon]